MDKSEIGLTSEDSGYSNQLENRSSLEENIEKEKLGQLDIASNLEEILIEEFVDSKIVDSVIVQEKLKDVIVDLIIEESNYVKESYIEVIRDLDVLCRNIVNHENEKLTNFDIASEIK